MSGPPGYDYGQFPDYEDRQMGWHFPLSEEINKLPDISSLKLETTTGSSSRRSKGKGKAESSKTPVTEIIKKINPKWTPINRPQLQIQKIMRDIVIDLAIQGKEKGKFTIKDVYMSNGVAKVAVSVSSENLKQSLLGVAKIFFCDKDATCLELDNFYKAIINCVTHKDFKKLYFQPLLYSESETMYFLLDILLVADHVKKIKKQGADRYDGIIKQVLCQKYSISNVVSKAKKFEGLLDNTKYGDTYHSLVGIAKVFFHHFTYLGQNLSMEEIYGYLYQVSPDMHLHVFKLLSAAGFDFSSFCRH